jgi:hypothetical protein
MILLITAAVHAEPDPSTLVIRPNPKVKSGQSAVLSIQGNSPGSKLIMLCDGNSIIHVITVDATNLNPADAQKNGNSVSLPSALIRADENKGLEIPIAQKIEGPLLISMGDVPYSSAYNTFLNEIQHAKKSIQITIPSGIKPVSISFPASSLFSEKIEPFRAACGFPSASTETKEIPEPELPQACNQWFQALETCLEDVSRHLTSTGTSTTSLNAIKTDMHKMKAATGNMIQRPEFNNMCTDGTIEKTLKDPILDTFNYLVKYSALSDTCTSQLVSIGVIKIGKP